MPYTPKSKLNESLAQAIEADDCERVKRLLDKGADVNAKNSRSQPCLVIAAENHADVEIIRLLVSAPGVDVNAKESRGSALYFAVYNKDLDTAKVLLEHGAQLRRGFGRRFGGRLGRGHLSGRVRSGGR